MSNDVGGDALMRVDVGTSGEGERAGDHREEVVGLIARLEKATEPSRDLDARIWWVVDRHRAERAYWNAAAGLPRALPDEMPSHGLGTISIHQLAPHYTSSIDAALTLVPKGYLTDLESHRTDNGDQFTWYVWRPEIADKGCAGRGRNMVICLCIAALRARQKLQVAGAKGHKAPLPETDV